MVAEPRQCVGAGGLGFIVANRCNFPTTNVGGERAKWQSSGITATAVALQPAVAALHGSKRDLLADAMI
jgi:hypothetical protein